MWRKILAVALLLALAVFVGMNLETARVWFFGPRIEMPIALVVLASGVIGLAAGLLIAFVRRPASPSKKPGT